MKLASLTILNETFTVISNTVKKETASLKMKMQFLSFLSGILYLQGSIGFNVHSGHGSPSSLPLGVS